LLLGVVLVVPLVVAIAVTLWTLEQAIKRNRKNQPDRVARRVSEPVAETGVAGASGSTLHASREQGETPIAEPIPAGPPATPDVSGSPGDGGSSSD
jgi:hypothetical protein